MSTSRSDLSVFAYGTLAVPEVMLAVTGNSFPSTPAILEGYSAFLIEGECFPAVAVTSGGVTTGVMYLGLDKPTLKLLDKFEGDLYQRKRVAVRSETLGLMSAETHIIGKQAKDRLTSEPWDMDSFLSKHLEEWLEVCADFKEKGKR